MLQELVEVDVTIPPSGRVQVHVSGIQSIFQVDTVVPLPGSVQVDIIEPFLENVHVIGLPGPPGPQGPPGPEGPEGPPGDSAAAYTHMQNTASALWTIVHGLDFVPNVMVVDSSGREVFGDVTVIDGGTMSVEFSAAFGGKAYLS